MLKSISFAEMATPILWQYNAKHKLEDYALSLEQLKGWKDGRGFYATVKQIFALVFHMSYDKSAVCTVCVYVVLVCAPTKKTRLIGCVDALHAFHAPRAGAEAGPERAEVQRRAE